MPAPASRVTSEVPFLIIRRLLRLFRSTTTAAGASADLPAANECGVYFVQVVTWGHPCCFERAKRRAGTPDENRAWFHVTVDLCREQWLILHKIDYVEEMR